MPQENLTNQQEEKTEGRKPPVLPSVNPFQTLKVRKQPYQDLECRTVFRATSMKIDEKTHQTCPVFEEFDLAEEVRKCQDLAGMDYMKRLLATGQAKPEDFYDDGKSGIDTTLFPSTVHEARDKANEANDDLAKIAKALGMTDEGITQKSMEDLLSAKIKELWEKQQAAAQAKAAEGDKQ
jgi:hypothetical protein